MNSRQTSFYASVIDTFRALPLPESRRFPTHDAVVAQLDEPAVFIGATFGKEPAKLGQSKVGGTPDVPSGFSWPREGGEEDDGEPLAFVAQLNLAEIHLHDLSERLPAQGMVWLFAMAHADRAAGGELDASTTRVLYERAPGALSPHEIPEELTENVDATIEERALLFGPTIDYGTVYDVTMTKVLDDALERVGGRSGPVSLLDVVDWDELYGDDLVDDDGGAPEPGISLVSFSGYDLARNAFGEGTLRFVLNPAQLANGELDGAEVVFTPGT